MKRSSLFSSVVKLFCLSRLQLREWELKYEALHRDNLALMEEKCELEEAENDSRLHAQRYDYNQGYQVQKNENGQI